MNRIFRHLSAAEEARILGEAESRRAAPGETIVREGEPRTGIFVIRSGAVRVEKDSAGFPLEISRLGPGEIFGEMSFVEGSQASASVVAEDDQPVEVVRIAQEQVEPLLEAEPGVYGRFYKSLAEILSLRLRTTSSLMATPDWSPRGFPAREEEHAAAERRDWGPPPLLEP